MSKRTALVVDPNLQEGLQEIADFERKIMRASEETWEFHGVPHEERAALRPAVAKIAQAVTDQLRVEHTERQR